MAESQYSDVPNPFAGYTSEPPQPSAPTMASETFEDVPNPFGKYVTEDQLESTEEVGLYTGGWADNDSVQGARMFLEGMTSGWSDEIGLGIAAVAASLTTGNDISDIYGEMKQEYNAQKNAYKDKNKGVATALEIAGSIASPITYMGGAPATVTRAVARGAGEGALYAAGTSQSTDEMVSDIQSGALVGGVISGTLGGAGWLFNATTRNKLATMLEGADGTFTPMTLAAKPEMGGAENALHTFYKDVVGPSLGGKGVLRQQEEVIVAPLVLRQKNREALLETVQKEAKINTARASAQLKSAVNSISESAGKRGIKAKEKDALNLIENNYKEFLGEKGAVMARATKQIKEATDTAQDAFRLAAFDSALPAGIPKLEIKRIMEAGNPNVAMQRLDEAWSTYGFSSIKERSFRINPTNLEKDLVSRISKDPTFELLASTKGEIGQAVGNVLNFVANKTKKGGFIKGDELSTVRSALGTAAATKSDAGGNPALMQAVYREMQNSIDDLIEKQLGAKGLQQFKADRQAWKSNILVRDAVTKTSKKTDKFGKFTPDDWLTAIASNSPKEARQGTGPLRQHAEQYASQVQKANETITKSARELQSKLAERKAREIARVNNKSTAQLNKLEAKVKQLKTRARLTQTDALELAKNEKTIAALKAEINAGKEELAVLNKLRVNQSPSWFHSLAATGILERTFGYGARAALALPAAVGLGKGLASPTGQKIVAGQTAPQMAIQDVLNSKVLPEIVNFTPQVTTRDILQQVPVQAARLGASSMAEEPRREGMLTGQ